MYSNYFLTLVKETNDSFTLLVVPRVEGVKTRHMTMSGSTTAGTAFVDFDDAKVPVEFVVGERGQGFKYIVSNFNHEVGSTEAYMSELLVTDATNIEVIHRLPVFATNQSLP